MYFGEEPFLSQDEYDLVQKALKSKDALSPQERLLLKQIVKRVGMLEMRTVTEEVPQTWKKHRVKSLSISQQCFLRSPTKP